jgi:hypothetical protein
MARFAVIQDGNVVNLVEAEEPLFDNWIADDGSARIGGIWTGTTFEAPPMTLFVPPSVSMRQARLALLQAGKLDGVANVIAAIPDPIQRQAAQISWDFAGDVRRDSPLVALIGSTMGMADAEIDTLFIDASAR